MSFGDINEAILAPTLAKYIFIKCTTNVKGI